MVWTSELQTPQHSDLICTSYEPKGLGVMSWRENLCQFSPLMSVTTNPLNCSVDMIPSLPDEIGYLAHSGAVGTLYVVGPGQGTRERANVRETVVYVTLAPYETRDGSRGSTVGGERLDVIATPRAPASQPRHPNPPAADRPQLTARTPRENRPRGSIDRSTWARLSPSALQIHATQLVRRRRRDPWGQQGAVIAGTGKHGRHTCTRRERYSVGCRIDIMTTAVSLNQWASPAQCSLYLASSSRSSSSASYPSPTLILQSQPVSRQRACEGRAFWGRGTHRPSRRPC